MVILTEKAKIEPLDIDAQVNMPPTYVHFREMQIGCVERTLNVAGGLLEYEILEGQCILDRAIMCDDCGCIRVS